MSDPALHALFERLRNASGRKLLIADEHLDCSALLQLKAIPDLQILTNRQDIQQCAQQAGLSCVFNDMDLTPLDTGFDLIAYRISKEKALVHHIINQSARHLSPQGELVLAGFKDEGTKTYISKAEQYFGCKAQIVRGERQLQIATLQPQRLGEPLDARQYSELQLIAEQDGLRIFSKPGQYGWNKIDSGSVHLIDCLRQQLQDGLIKPATALDLGCGYGYLALHAARLGIAAITATDNNAAAVFSCRHNFTENRINGEVIADDCAASLSAQFDLVLCNPPFHRGFETEQALTEKFVVSAFRHLKKGGSALFVINHFIPLDAVAAPWFRGVELLFRDKQFKVFKLSC